MLLKEKINKDGFIISTFTGNSMYPFLSSENDKVVISKPIDIRLYDVVLYMVENKKVLHRIIGMDEESYLIRGDNCINTERISKDDVIGVLKGFYNKDKYIELNDDINRKAFLKSKRSLLYRRFKGKLKRLF